MNESGCKQVFIFSLQLKQMKGLLIHCEILLLLVDTRFFL